METTHYDEPEARTFILDAESFAKLSPEKKMAEILKEAPTLRKLGKSALLGAEVEEKRNYMSMEWAGAPHKGKTTDIEKRLVQKNFDAINERLRQQGLREIDLANREHVERYDLQKLAQERGIKLV
ncbi:MAG TPA: hypothetical protein VLF60_03100 [Candidatus Saccharimonadales bacterium]|nr:hypothetical protein [Candidatus Saccharimonadales bacterium]